jgi:chitinase
LRYIAAFVLGIPDWSRTASSTPGPNAPLDNACHNSTQPLANAVAAVKSWNKAGMPLEKITLGVPS